jgi:hypothetical protein
MKVISEALLKTEAASKGAQQVVSAGQARPMQQPPNILKRTLQTLGRNPMRAAGMEATIPLEDRPALPPAVRVELANILATGGPDLQARLAELADRIAAQRSMTGRGALTGAVGTANAIREQP